MNLELARELSLINGTSGNEERVREYILNKLPPECETAVDALGNLIVTKKGAKTPKNKVMLCAHMDEVGFIATMINDDGSVKFAPVGGINASAVFGRRVRSESGALGVIAAKATHLVKDEEKEKQPEISALSIDIGASSAEEAAKSVRQGECFCFESEFFRFGEDMLKGKALDDRVGCAVLIELLNTSLPCDLTCVFTVQEEIGTRGAQCAAYNVKPDFAIVLETTTACDIAGVDGEKQVCRLGEGAVVSFMDKGTIYDKELYRLAFETARANGIPVQTKTAVAGGNDSGAIHKAVGGIRTAAISVPTRYLHTPACVMKLSDVEAVEKLARLFSEQLCAL